MNLPTKIFKLIHNPLESMGHMTPLEWLQAINQPICIFIEGKDTSRTRALSTLLHGNEPSGFYALINWIKENKQPAVNIVCFIPGIDAALREPHFHHRTAESGVDLNRVFKPPFQSKEGKVAEEILSILEFIRPEALVDIHNTSGFSPDFSVVCQDFPLNKEIASLFTEEYIIFNLKLSTLVEAVESYFPCVVIECGGSDDPDSISKAQRGISEYFSLEYISDIPPHDISVRDNPVRIKLKPTFALDYRNHFEEEFDLILPTDADKYNSMTLKANDFVGWVGRKGLDCFDCVNLPVNESIESYFYVDNNALYAKQSIRLYMVTTNLEIALNDCLFYLLKS